MARYLMACTAVLLAGCSAARPAAASIAAAAAAAAPGTPGAAAAPAAAPASPAAGRPGTAAAPASPAPASAPAQRGSCRVAAAPAPPAPPATAAGAGVPDITVPSGTTLSIELRTPLASDNSTVEEDVHGVLRRALVVDGVEVVPAGATVPAASPRPYGRPE